MTHSPKWRWIYLLYQARCHSLDPNKILNVICGSGGKVHPADLTAVYMLSCCRASHGALKSPPPPVLIHRKRARPANLQPHIPSRLHPQSIVEGQPWRRVLSNTHSDCTTSPREAMAGWLWKAPGAALLSLWQSTRETVAVFPGRKRTQIGAKSSPESIPVGTGPRS